MKKEQSLLVMSTLLGKKQFKELKRRDTEEGRLKYLSDGSLSVAEWYNIKQNKKFFRPVIKGIAVALSSDDFKQYATEKEALEYGAKVILWINNRIKQLGS